MIKNLQAFCQGSLAPPAGTPAFSPFLPLQFWDGLFSTGTGLTYSGQDAYVGIWGDADPDNINDWLKVDVAATASVPSSTWTEATATCSNVVTGARVNILYARVGSAANPQFKISYASVK